MMKVEHERTQDEDEIWGGDVQEVEPVIFEHEGLVRMRLIVVGRMTVEIDMLPSMAEAIGEHLLTIGDKMIRQMRGED